MSQDHFQFQAGKLPLLVSIPHNGAFIPYEFEKLMTEAGRVSQDTDWYLNRLYQFPELENASVIVSHISRYVIDLNRPKEDYSLYPGQTTTGLIPYECFDGKPIYSEGYHLSEEAIQSRIVRYWLGYHEKIELELERLLDIFGKVVLFDAHSIMSRVPRLFEGTLPHLNFGTNEGNSCDESLTSAIESAIENEQFSSVINGRFKGGFITRHYGNPQSNVHAIQLELSQETYLNESNHEWNEEKVATIQPVLQKIIRALIDWVCEQ